MWWPETGSVSPSDNGISNLQILKGAESAKSARMPKRSRLPQLDTLRSTEPDIRASGSRLMVQSARRGSGQHFFSNKKTIAYGGPESTAIESERDVGIDFAQNDFASFVL
jgi:hypothetical protein